MRLNILILLMLFISVVTVTAEYPYTGYDDFRNDRSNLDLGQTIPFVGSDILTGALYHPYWVDIEDDGNEELIILDDDEIKIYSAVTLDSYVSLQLNSSFDWSPPTFYDWDQDGNQDMLIGIREGTGTNNFFIYLWNGTNFELDESHNISVGDSNMIVSSCNEDGCLIVGFPFSDLIDLVWFTSSGEQDATTLSTLVASGSCTSIPPYSVNYDGEYYYFATSCAFGGTARTRVYKYGIVADTLTSIAGYTETGSYSKAFISPIGFDLDNDAGNGNEVVASYHDSNEDELILYVFNEDMSIREKVGSTYAVTADIITNPSIGSVFDDSIGRDYCAGGYDITNSKFRILCGSLTSSSLNHEYIANSPYNLTSTNYLDYYYLYENMFHMSDQSNAYSGDEFITNYGIIAYDNDDCSGILDIDCNVYSVFISSSEDKVLMVDDKNNNGYADIAMLKDNSIRYHSILISNTGAEINDWCIYPCLDSGALQVNTTVSVIFDAIDDYDKVQSRAYLYYGTDDEILSNWTTFVSSGTDMQHTFSVGNGRPLNVTTSSAVLRIEVRDEENLDDIDHLEFTYSVSDTGVLYGDCSTCGSEETTTETGDETEGGAVTESDNVLTDAISEMESNFNIPSILIFIIIMVIIIYNIWVSPITERNPQVTFGIIFIVSALMLILGVKLGIISFGFLITLIILAIIPTGIWIGKKVIGHSE